MHTFCLCGHQLEQEIVVRQKKSGTNLSLPLKLSSVSPHIRWHYTQDWVPSVYHTYSAHQHQDLHWGINGILTTLDGHNLTQTHMHAFFGSTFVFCWAAIYVALGVAVFLTVLWVVLKALYRYAILINYLLLRLLITTHLLCDSGVPCNLGSKRVILILSNVLFWFVILIHTFTSFDVVHFPFLWL